jgi:Phosphatidylinositol-specific phospholipase C, X domain/Phosphatidylinositol-specific phospholipase C, Y domain
LRFVFFCGFVVDDGSSLPSYAAKQSFNLIVAFHSNNKIQAGSLQPRKIAFSKDRRQLYVTSRRLMNVLLRSSVASVGLHWVDRVEKGSLGSSQRFLLLENNAVVDDQNLKGLTESELEKRSLTLHYLSNNNDKLESLDLVVPSQQQFDVLWNALEDLLDLAKLELNAQIASSQCLHYQWRFILDKEWKTPLTHSDWMTLTERTHIKKSVLSTMFKETAGEAELISFDQTARLLECLRPENDPVEQIWNDLIGTDPVPVDPEEEDGSTDGGALLDDLAESISPVALLSFIRSQQKKYNSTLEQVNEIVQLLNYQIAPDDSTNMSSSATNRLRLSKSRFISWLTADTNDIVDKHMSQVGSDDMGEPLSHYWINTSHDTYQSNKTSVPSAMEYTNALHRGVRCLEVDIYESDDSETADPVVGGGGGSANNNHHSGTTHKIPLRHVLRAIRAFLNHYPYTYPILLKLEYHCRTSVQLKVATMLYEFLGAANLLVRPIEGQLLTANIHLPSPESARGRVIVIGKRPMEVKPGCTVLHDDTDETLDEGIADFDDSEEPEGYVVGFDINGPVRSIKRPALERSSSELLSVAVEEARRAAVEAEEANVLKDELWKQVDLHEEATASMTQKAGMAPKDLKRRAARARDEEQREEEGIEIHEALNQVVSASEDAYAMAAQESMEAAQATMLCTDRVKDIEKALDMADRNLEQSRMLEKKLISAARKAAIEARSSLEHAQEASDRVDRVRELFKDSQNHASSAGTVVQTALTEAKISEKRALDAESRAHRARSAAEQDRARADAETQKEEDLEREVNELHLESQNAIAASKATAIRLEKTHAMLERVNEQIKLIESSSQYKKERETIVDTENENFVRNTSSFVAKHEAKTEERSTLRDTAREAAQDKTASEARVVMLKRKFEDHVRAWRAQANVASQARRAADRSVHVAEELVEHAEEEREAADLRLTAREKAVATVENRGSQRESVEAQLAEAERAAREAEEVAIQCRLKAEDLERQSIAKKDHSSFIEAVFKRKKELREAEAALADAAREQKLKDELAAHEKQRLDANASVYQSATDSSLRVHVVEVLQQEAIVAYNTTLMLRKQAENAVSKAEIATTAADSKRQAADHARRYKSKRDVTMEIPLSLAKSTLVHSARFRQWSKSLTLSSSIMHSFTHHGLEDELEQDPVAKQKFFTFTKHHLCRVIPTVTGAKSDKSAVLPWSVGCQLVATDYHKTSAFHISIADGRFRKNGSCGYVLKPVGMWDDNSATQTPETWTFSIMGAYNLPRLGRRVWKPTVRLSLYTGDGKAMTKSTPSAHFHEPYWHQQNSFNFTVLTPTISMFLIVLCDESDYFVASAAIPADCLREGYRSVCLFNRDHARVGAMKHCTLFVKATRLTKPM